MNVGEEVNGALNWTARLRGGRPTLRRCLAGSWMQHLRLKGEAGLKSWRGSRAEGPGWDPHTAGEGTREGEASRRQGTFHRHKNQGGWCLVEEGREMRPGLQ